MPPHYGQEFIHCHRACAEIASALVIFLRQAKIVALSMALFFCRVESKSKDDFKFPVMVEDGKHSCTEVYSLHPSKINSVQRCFVSSTINLEYYKQLHIETNHCICGGKSVVKKS